MHLARQVAPYESGRSAASWARFTPTPCAGRLQVPAFGSRAGVRNFSVGSRSNGIAARHQAVAIVLDLIEIQFDPDGGLSAGDGRQGSMRYRSHLPTGYWCAMAIILLMATSEYRVIELLTEHSPSSCGKAPSTGTSSSRRMDFKLARRPRLGTHPSRWIRRGSQEPPPARNTPCS